MDEQGFDFKPAERRDPRRFEPPPWEQDAFEQRRREAEKDRPQEASEEVARPEPAERGQPEPPESPAEPVAAAAVMEAKPSRGDCEPVELEEGRVSEMLAALSVEDPPVEGGYRKVAAGVGLGTLALGAVLIMWGMAAFVGGRETGTFGRFTGVGLALFGAFFVSAGAWLVYRTLKQQGVL